MVEQQIITRTTCRVCGSEQLTNLFSLGNIYVSTFVASETDPGIKAPLDLIACEVCSLVQLRHTAPQELMYSKHYWYRSGLNPVITADLKQVTEVAQQLVELEDQDIVLDIGANDGTLLKHYPTNLIRVGCEPATNLTVELKKVTNTVIDDFWSYETWTALMGDKKAKIITAFGMFYDMEDPNQFLRDATYALDPNGIFIAQLMCLKPMLDQNDLGNICHEHLEYYSYDSLRYFFEQNGLEIFRVEENSINGGSYRLFARHLSRGSIDYGEKLTHNDYMDFFNRINENRDSCVSFIKSETEKGKKVYAYGASTKGNSILQYYGLDNRHIVGAADKDPEKWGKYTIGTLIPIVDEDTAREQADYFLVLPWAFFETFFEREQEWLNQGGQFIVPIPNFRIVGRDDAHTR